MRNRSKKKSSTKNSPTPDRPPMVAASFRLPAGLLEALEARAAHISELTGNPTSPADVARVILSQGVRASVRGLPDLPERSSR